MSLAEYFPIIEDVRASYRSYREQGGNRQEGVEKTLAEYAAELSDTDDDGPQVWIGLAEVLGRRKELTEEIRAKAEQAFADLERAFPEVSAQLRARTKVVCADEKLGPEAAYKKRNAYVPDWKIGDTFVYQIRWEGHKDSPLFGWYIVLRKSREIVWGWDNVEQVFYVSVCPPDRIPKTTEDLEMLGYVVKNKVRIQGHLRGYRYELSIPRISKRKEKLMGLQKIGCFPDARPPLWKYPTQTVENTLLLFSAAFQDGCFAQLERYVIGPYEHGIGTIYLDGHAGKWDGTREILQPAEPPDVTT